MANRSVDFQGRVFGDFVVLSRSESGPKGDHRWLCRCACGSEKIVYGHSLVSGNSKWCPRCKKNRPRIPKTALTSDNGVLYKDCTVCKLSLPSTAFCKNKNNLSGLNSRCKQCANESGKRRKYPENVTATEKLCNLCCEIKPLAAFSKHATGAFGRRGSCKSCIYAKEVIYRERTKEERAEYHKNYAKQNKSKIRAYQRKHYEANRVEMAAYSANWFQQNKEWVVLRNKEKEQNDPQFKLSRLLRTRLCMAMKGDAKTGSAVRDLGCSIEFFKQRLESLFELGMSWDNHGIKDGEWSIDHIVPMSAFELTKRQHVVLACHFLNLRPMWHKDNLAKSNTLGDYSGISIH